MTLYSFAKRMFRLQFRVMGWKVEGAENLPLSGPVILAINHVSIWDPVLAACSLPRQVSFMAKEELFSIPILGTIFSKLGAFPVKRGQGDMNAIRQSLAILKQGRILGLFPEGTRSKTGEIQKGMPGMVLLMEKSQASVVPVKVYGTANLMTKGWGKIGVVIGKPLTAQMLKAPEGVENRREWIADRIMQAMIELPKAK
ncbi:lysophospholipid acyltransferase family protein [Desulfosporosinus burensis]|uniref:lysophospholipid acyltransferase family protein n=1 Tax=Desulfosporosinus sp. BICA1-9 TaxID=1531958 RepID=UPI00054C4C33|nr:lysophospholipid acyltransferase family protein [Desulfosporosinus sp. BICA1-9]KJS48263.1 MAG: acyl-phosphate glycerol 3-phosphate acyltransferase [Peptococcaceae bacterium BRH_c23]KJS89355.1 MAG: acyl-phosphate glycerol 3-phosphate acyltransferase [Desulfosporosinus sp. BICA1-9]